MTQIIKNVLIIFVIDIKVKRLFFITRDVIIYRRNKFRNRIIKRIIMIKRIE